MPASPNPPLTITEGTIRIISKSSSAFKLMQIKTFIRESNAELISNDGFSSRRSDQEDRVRFLTIGQKCILLSFVESMNFVYNRTVLRPRCYKGLGLALTCLISFSRMLLLKNCITAGGPGRITANVVLCPRQVSPEMKEERLRLSTICRKKPRDSCNRSLGPTNSS